MAAPLVPQKRLLASSGREFDLWQACREFAEKSSKIVPLGAPHFKTVDTGVLIARHSFCGRLSGHPQTDSR
jgi:hypothetical protein